MQYNIKIYLIVFLQTFFIGNSQNKVTLQLQDTISFKADSLLAIDNYGFNYFLKENAVLKTNFKKEYDYQNTTLGKPDYLDASNPLQLVLFYKKFNTVVLLDNQLNETTLINGNFYGLVFDAVALSRQNSFWFYDLVSQKFGVFNFQENSFRFISIPLFTTVKNFAGNYNYFYWLDADGQLFSISYFGKIEKQPTQLLYDTLVLVNNTEYLLVVNDTMRYVKNGTTYELNLDKNSPSNICFKDGILSIFTHNLIANYKIILP